MLLWPYFLFAALILTIIIIATKDKPNTTIFEVCATGLILVIIFYALFAAVGSTQTETTYYPPSEYSYAKAGEEAIVFILRDGTTYTSKLALLYNGVRDTDTFYVMKKYSEWGKELDSEIGLKRLQ